MGQIKNLLSAVVAFSLVTSLYAQPHYDYSKLQREDLGRGVVAIRESENAVCLSWRYLSSDPVQTTFNVYRNGEKIAEFSTFVKYPNRRFFLYGNFTLSGARQPSYDHRQRQGSLY